MQFNSPESIRQKEQTAAAPFRGQTLRVWRMDLTNPDPDIMNYLKQSIVKSAFALQPFMGVRAVDQFGANVENGTLVFIIENKGGEASLTQNVSHLA